MDVPRQAYAVLVRSPHAHARIVRIDTRGALKSPGVLAVLTGADVAADGLGNLPTDRTRKRRDGTPAFATPRPLLARERVRHVGDPVALVVADAHQHAADAAERVAVEDRKSTRLNSSHTVISYAVFCLKKKTNT